MLLSACSCYSRFANMQIEWLALWIHFMWSGILTTIFCIATWRKMGTILHVSGKESSGGQIGATKKRRRLLRIAVMVTFCLFLNAVATLSVSGKLDTWGRTADLALACSTKETHWSRDWDAYGFNENEVVNVCRQEDAIRILRLCKGDCILQPAITTDHLVCMYVDSGDFDIAEPSNFISPEDDLFDHISPCDCPCDSLVEIEKPRCV